MKYRKTPQTLRGTYKLYDDDGNFITEYKPGKDGVTEVDIHNLHRIDDHEVYSEYAPYIFSDIKRQCFTQFVD